MDKHSVLKPATFLLTLLIGSLIFIYSCNSEDKKVETADFKMDCRKITKNEIQKNWVDNGWTSDTSTTKIVQIWLSVNKIGSQIQIDAIPMKSWNSFIQGGKFKVGRDNKCDATLGDKLEYVDNWLKFSDLNIIKNPATGELIDFDHIQLTPKDDGNGNVIYDVSIIIKKADGTTAKAQADFPTYPCPPHCPEEPTVTNEQPE